MSKENKRRFFRSPEQLFPKEILDQREDGEPIIDFLRRIAEKGENERDVLKKYGVPIPQWYAIHESESGEIVLVDEEELCKIKSKIAPTEKINWKGKKWELTKKAYNEWIERVTTEPIDLYEVFAEYAERYLWHGKDILNAENLQSTHDWALNNSKYDYFEKY